MDTEHPDLETFRQIRLDEIRRSRQTQHRDASVASSSTMRPMTSTYNVSTERGTPEGSWSQNYFDDYLPVSEAMDVEPREGDYLPSVDSNQIKFVVATDFGTTFSSVAFTRRFQGIWEPPQSVSRYPHDPFVLNGRESFEVPTQSCYPDIAMVRDNADEDMSTPETGEEIKDIFEEDDEIEDQYSHMDHQESGDDREDSVGDEDRNIIIPEPDHAQDEENGLQFYHWGYQIQDLMRSDTLSLSQFQHLERFKLILDQSEKTKEIRDTLRPILARLKKWAMIKEDHDIITDYLTKLFIHTKEQIREGDSDFNDTCPIEHVLCVPNAWSSKACRVMQKAMESAIRRSSFGTLDNLFIITEPEAAATYVLHENSRISVYDGETFIILDAGGGTVDITTYTVIGNHPLRLREALIPKGALCGSSYLNQNFRAHLLERLKLEAYLEDDRITIEEMIDEAMIEFENKWKRTVDFGDRRDSRHQVPGWSVKIPGLREDRRKRFIENYLLIEHNDLHGIFLPLLREIGNLMEDQICVARSENLFVKKVMLVGGFAGSPSLRGYLRYKLNRISRQFGHVTELVSPQFSYDTAVSLGAVRRALHKENGPLRISKSSFGFIRTDLYDKENIPAHIGIRPKIDPLDGRKYVSNTIYWLVQQGDTILSRQEYSLEVEHTFSLSRRKLLCEEILYVSDQRGESHYRRNHPKNRDTEEAGRIVADMTFLLTNRLIQPSEPEEGFKGKRHYKVCFELVMIIEGRNLRFEARYPVGGQVVAGKRFCIAAAFQPGTE